MDLNNQEQVLSRIRKFETELSAELDKQVSLIAYVPKDEEELGHA